VDCPCSLTGLGSSCSPSSLSRRPHPARTGDGCAAWSTRRFASPASVILVATMSVSLDPGPITEWALGPSQSPGKRPRRITCRRSKQPRRRKEADATFIHHLSIHLAETRRALILQQIGETEALREGSREFERGSVPLRWRCSG
jgi:hypothetical protein